MRDTVKTRVSFFGLLGIKECGYVMCNVSTLPLHSYTQHTPGQVSHYECSHTSVGVWGQSPSRVTLWVSWHIRDKHTAFVSHHSRHNYPSAHSLKLPVLCCCYQPFLTTNTPLLCRKIELFSRRKKFCYSTYLNESSHCHGVFWRHWCLGWRWCQQASVPLNTILMLMSQ